MVVYIAQVVLALLLVVLFELDVLPVGVCAVDKQSEFQLTALMELVTLGAAFLGLRLFKFSNVHDELFCCREPAMWKWGLVRLLILEVPMVINTLLYYLYMNPTFGYLAIILLLCLPFVFPSEGRCKADTETL